MSMIGFDEHDGHPVLKHNFQINVNGGFEQAEWSPCKGIHVQCCLSLLVHAAATLIVDSILESQTSMWVAVTAKEGRKRDRKNDADKRKSKREGQNRLYKDGRKYRRSVEEGPVFWSNAASPCLFELDIKAQGNINDEIGKGPSTFDVHTGRGEGRGTQKDEEWKGRLRELYTVHQPQM